MHDGAEFDQSKNIGVVQANAKKKYIFTLPDPKGRANHWGGILQQAAKKAPTFFFFIVPPPGQFFQNKKANKQASNRFWPSKHKEETETVLLFWLHVDKVAALNLFFLFYFSFFAAHEDFFQARNAQNRRRPPETAAISLD